MDHMVAEGFPPAGNRAGVRRPLSLVTVSPQAAGNGFRSSWTVDHGASTTAIRTPSMRFASPEWSSSVRGRRCCAGQRPWRLRRQRNTLAVLELAGPRADVEVALGSPRRLSSRPLRQPPSSNGPGGARVRRAFRRAAARPFATAFASRPARRGGAPAGPGRRSTLVATGPLTKRRGSRSVASPSWPPAPASVRLVVMGGILRARRVEHDTHRRVSTSLVDPEAAQQIVLDAFLRVPAAAPCSADLNVTEAGAAVRAGASRTGSSSMPDRRIPSVRLVVRRASLLHGSPRRRRGKGYVRAHCTIRSALALALDGIARADAGAWGPSTSSSTARSTRGMTVVDLARPLGDAASPTPDRRPCRSTPVGSSTSSSAASPQLAAAHGRLGFSRPAPPPPFSSTACPAAAAGDAAPRARTGSRRRRAPGASCGKE